MPDQSTPTVGGTAVVVPSSDWLDWLDGAIADVTAKLKCREDMAATCRHGTDAEWAAAAPRDSRAKDHAAHAHEGSRRP